MTPAQVRARRMRDAKLDYSGRKWRKMASSYMATKTNNSIWLDNVDITPYVQSATMTANPTPGWWNTTNGTITSATTTPSSYTVRITTNNTVSPSTTITGNTSIIDGDPMAGRRRLPPREFNKYLNTSDLLEEFIGWLGSEGVRQGEVMDLPIELFIKWLIVRAAEADGEEPEVEVTVPKRLSQPRCLGCQRWMPRNCALPVHGRRCAELHFRRQEMSDARHDGSAPHRRDGDDPTHRREVGVAALP